MCDEHKKRLRPHEANAVAMCYCAVIISTYLISFVIYRFVNALVYYGVILSAPSIGGNFYLNFFLTSLVELPAIPAGVWVFNRFVKR